MESSMPHITAAELRVLKALWRRGSATVRNVLDDLNDGSDEPAAYTTVMTLMNQLAAKGVLAVEKSRQPFVYKAAVRRESVLADRVRQFVAQVFDGQAGELVLRLVEEEELSAEDIKRIEAKIAKKEAGDAVGRSRSTRRPRPEKGG